MGRGAAKEWTTSTRTERVATGTTVDQPPVKGMWCEAGVERTEEETTVTASVGDNGVDLALLGDAALAREKVCSFADG
jgi:hypothetical protein